MFAPEGYMPVATLWEKAFEKEEIVKRYIWDTDRAPFNYMMDTFENILQRWMFEFCGNHIFISDGFCRPINISPQQLFSNQLYWVLSCGPEDKLSFKNLKGFTEKTISKYNLADPDIILEQIELMSELMGSIWEGKPDESINSSDEFIEMKNKLIDVSGFSRAFIFLNPQFYQLDTEMLRIFEDFSDQEIDHRLSDGVREVAKRLVPFEGFYLCIPKKLYEEEWSTFWDNIYQTKVESHRTQGWGYGNEPWLDRKSGQKIGRPRKQEAALVTYKRVYPSGHGDDSWPMVLQNLSAASGQSFSIETLQRALGLR